MTENTTRAEAVLDGSLRLIDYIYELAEIDKAKEPGERPWDGEYWKMVQEAERAGKKLILMNGPAPVELIYAMDMVPLYLDLIPGRLLMDATLTGQLIHLTEVRANDKLCSLHKTITGLVLAERLASSAAAYVGTPILCDSARTACAETARYTSLPTFQFDLPLLRGRKNSLDYIAVQIEHFITFLEQVSGNTMDWGAVKERMALYNRAARLAEENRALRKNRPCPLSSRLALQNELMNAMGPTQAMSALLEQEKVLCESRLRAGGSPCAGGEKHRVFLHHNLMQIFPALTGWLEERYGAVTVLDGYGLAAYPRFEAPDDRAASLLVMAARMATGSAAHGGGISGEEKLAALGGLIADYAPDVFLFLGSRGCRHEWAESKLVSDALQEKYGSSMLMMDMDNTDLRYKSPEEIRSAIAEYMETVVGAKPVAAE